MPATPTRPPPTSTPGPLTLWIDPAVPLAVRDHLAEAWPSVATIAAASRDAADITVGLSGSHRLARWVYAAVAPFPTISDGLQWSDVQQFWAGDTGAMANVTGSDTAPVLLVSAETLGVLHGLLGPSSEQVPITVIEPESMVDAAWAARPSAWAILPFTELQPRWKALRVDACGVLERSLDLDGYALTVDVYLEGKGAADLVTALTEGSGEWTNREVDELTVLMMTGVTALVRGTASRMESKGVLYPIERIGELLQDPDILHISNEISFSEECPPPNPDTESLSFCSSPVYMELLRALGPEVIELTGNHVKDYGSAPMLLTLDMYDSEGWSYYGGGRNSEQARRPVRVESNGVTFAFIGCNPVGPEFAWATEESPGAAKCDESYLRQELDLLRAEGAVAVTTVQYWEFYQYEPTPQQRSDFRAWVDAGASIVSGSQAHHPQAIEFYRDGFIHYGLGNFLFDQMWSLGTRQEFVDRHVFYRGQHISTELLTLMLEDYSQPRPMTSQERSDLLQSIFRASGW